MPEASQEKARETEPGPVQEEEEEAEEETVSRNFDSIGEVVAVVQSCCTNALVELAVFLGDVFLVLRCERRILGFIQQDLGLSASVHHIGSFGLFDLDFFCWRGYAANCGGDRRDRWPAS